MNTAYLHLGSNIENRALHISKAILLIDMKIGQIINRSMIYETEPWGFKSDDKFLNMAIIVKTELNPDKVLEVVNKIENELGRVRNKKEYEPRIIDIDIILFNNDIIEEKDLKIPHPLMHLRKYVLQPLCELASDYNHPVFKKKIKTLLNECMDNCEVQKFKDKYIRSGPHQQN